MEQNKTHSSTKNEAVTYIFQTYSDRERLYNQHLLWRDVFNVAFTQVLKLGELDANSDTANWWLLDGGCGEGLYAEEILSKYPRTHIRGFDRDEEAIATANLAFGSVGDLLFFTHDALIPLSEHKEFGKSRKLPSSYDIAVAWLLLMNVKDAVTALRNIETIVKPGGTLLLFDIPLEWITFPNSSFMAIAEVISEALKHISSFGFGSFHQEQLEKDGFTNIQSTLIDVVIGGPTEVGQKWLRHYFNSFLATRPVVVESLGLMSAADFDGHINRIEQDITIDMVGAGFSMQTIARKPLKL